MCQHFHRKKLVRRRRHRHRQTTRSSRPVPDGLSALLASYSFTSRTRSWLWYWYLEFRRWLPYEHARGPNTASKAGALKLRVEVKVSERENPLSSPGTVPASSLCSVASGPSLSPCVPPGILGRSPSRIVRQGVPGRPRPVWPIGGGERS